MKRSGLSSNKPLKRTGYLRRTGRLSAPSKKSRVKEDLGVCELCDAARAIDPHHRLRRTQGGTDDRSNLLFLCRRCHDWIHDHPAESYQQGYLLRSGLSDNIAWSPVLEVWDDRQRA